jgi:hypothetical protein
MLPRGDAKPVEDAVALSHQPAVSRNGASGGRLGAGKDCSGVAGGALSDGRQRLWPFIGFRQ